VWKTTWNLFVGALPFKLVNDAATFVGPVFLNLLLVRLVRPPFWLILPVKFAVCTRAAVLYCAQAGADLSSRMPHMLWELRALRWSHERALERCVQSGLVVIPIMQRFARMRGDDKGGSGPVCQPCWLGAV
jgi:hypothetical protein